jgi:uncharacterized protein (DUF697 family)
MLRARSAGALGGGLALATLPLHAVLPHQMSVALAALMLAAIGAIYVGFALRDGRTRAIATEIIVAALFFVAATIGLTVDPWAIPVACFAHGVWDAAHHRHVDTAMPRWYIPFCALYDWVFAAGLALIWLR